MHPRRDRSQFGEDEGQAATSSPVTPPLPRSSTWRTLLIATLLCLWEGFPLGILGANPLIGYQLYAVITIAGVGIYLASRVVRDIGVSYWAIFAFILFLWCCLVSIIFSEFTSPQPLIQWLPAIYTVTPVLTIFLLTGLNVSLIDAQRAIFWTGLAASILVIGETLFHTGLLDFYARGSAFGDGKIVFFKLVSAFAFMIALVQAVQARTPAQILFNVIAAGLLGYSSMFLAESRIVLMSILLASGLTWLFVLRGTRKFVAGALAPLAVIPFLWLILTRFFANFTSIDAYLADDVSSNWRRTTAQHFANYFERETNGLGFGFMSGNANYNNIIAFSAARASQLYGVKDYVVTLDDIGIRSALYQYGYVGLALIFVMTVLCIFTLAQARRIDARYAPVSAIGILMGALMISPVSMNYFTLFYTAHLGGLLWFMAAEVSRMQRANSVAAQRGRMERRLSAREDRTPAA